MRAKTGCKSSAAMSAGLRPVDLKWLVCPVCRAALKLIAAAGGEAVECAGCARVFPVVDGIPVLLTHRTVSRI